MANRYSYVNKKPWRLPLTDMNCNRFDPATVSEGKQEHARGRESKNLSGLVATERPMNRRLINKLVRPRKQAHMQARKTGGQRGS